MSEVISIPVSAGEMFDKITILEIKEERIEDPAKRKNVSIELEALRARASKIFPDLNKDVVAVISQLRGVNSELWEIEDDIRDRERDKDFGEDFIRLARSVYTVNDKRARLKKTINIELESEIVEEKSYKSY